MIPILKAGVAVDPRIIRGAPVVVRNSSSAVKDNVFVYWVSPKGEIQPAADSRITTAQLQRWPEYKHWRRVEAVGAKEIEKVSLVIARQRFEQKKALKVQQHLREKASLEQLQFRCKLRIAQGYSKDDEELNRKMLRRAQKNEEDLYRLIASEFDPANRSTYLEMEMKPQSTSKSAMVLGKPTGVV